MIILFLKLTTLLKLAAKSLKIVSILKKNQYFKENFAQVSFAFLLLRYNEIFFKHFYHTMNKFIFHIKIDDIDFAREILQ